MKQIIKTLSVLLSVLAFTACDPVSNEDIQLNNNLEFTLGTPSVNGTEVTIDISHNGGDTDTWYCFASEDLKTNAAEVISSKTGIVNLQNDAGVVHRICKNLGIL